MTTIERAIRWKGRVHPSHPQPRSRGYPERVRMSALEFRLAETLGARRSRDGVRGRDGVLSSFLDTSRVAIRPISRFFFQLRIRCFMPRWCFRCVLLRAKEETLCLAKSGGSSLLPLMAHLGFERLEILRVFRRENCGSLAQKIIRFESWLSVRT